MAVEVYHFAVTVPAGTPQTAPVITATALPVRKISRISWRFPPGCAGLVGFRVTMGGVAVMPLPRGTFVIGDALAGSWDLTDQPDSGAWEVTAYNTGTFAHVLHVDYHAELTQPPARRPALPGLVELSQQPDARAAVYVPLGGR